MENVVNKINTNDKIALAQNSSENIKKLIYTIRGKQVMLDSDVAMLYHYETKKIIIVNTKMYNLGKIFLYKIVHFYLVLFVQFYFALLKFLCHIY